MVVDDTTGGSSLSRLAIDLPRRELPGRPDQGLQLDDQRRFVPDAVSLTEAFNRGRDQGEVLFVGSCAIGAKVSEVVTQEGVGTGIEGRDSHVVLHVADIWVVSGIGPEAKLALARF